MSMHQNLVTFSDQVLLMQEFYEVMAYRRRFMFMIDFDGVEMLCHDCRVRDLTTSRIGALTKITGQVVRTHPVHPELVSGVFVCLDCRTVIKDVEQQFKFSQVKNVLL